MAAYAALVSVMQIIDQLERHPSPPISIDKQQVESLTEIVTFLQDFLEGYDSPVAFSDEADPLEMRMADAAYAAEDVIESYIVDTIQLRRSTSTHHPSWNRLFNCYRGYNKEASSHGDDGEESRRWNNFCRDLHKVIEDMDRIKEVVMEMMRKKTAVQADQPQRSNISEKVTRGTLARQVIPITGMDGTETLPQQLHITTDNHSPQTQLTLEERVRNNQILKLQQKGHELTEREREMRLKMIEILDPQREEKRSLKEGAVKEAEAAKKAKAAKRNAKKKEKKKEKAVAHSLKETTISFPVSSIQ